MFKKQNIELGNGYQSVQGRGTSSLLKKTFEAAKAKHDPTFSYVGKFCESSVEVHKELSVSLGISANIYNIAPEVKGTYSKITETDNFSNYYVIHLTWEKYRQKLENLAQTDLVKNIAEELKSDPHRFYHDNGDEFISEVIYGQKMVVVIKIDKSQASKALKKGITANLNVPISGVGTVGGSVAINSVLESLHEESVADVQIFSVGIDSPDLQTSVVSNVKDLREKLQGFITKKPLPEVKSDTSDSNASKNPDKNTDKPTPPKSTNTAKSKAPAATANKPAAKQAAANNDKKDAKKSDAATSDKEDMIESVISFTSRPYYSLLSQKEQDEVRQKYDTMLQEASQVAKVLHFISECHARADLFLHTTQFARTHAEALNLNATSKAEIKETAVELKNYLRSLEKHSKAILRDIFDDKKQGTLKAGWEEAVRIAKELNELGETDDGVIDFHNNAFKLNEVTSSSSPQLHTALMPFWRRSSDYVNLAVPFETQKMLFKVIPGQGDNSENITFDLVRDHKIHVNGHERAHHLLEQNVRHLSEREPKYLDTAGLLFWKPTTDFLFIRHQNKPPRKYTAVLGSETNSKVYHQVAISNPHGARRPFTVQFYAQISRPVEPLHIPDAMPVGEIDHDSHTAVVTNFTTDIPMTHVHTSGMNALYGAMQPLGMAAMSAPIDGSRPPMISTWPGGTTRTLGDGNCAFNAVALLFADLAITNRLLDSFVLQRLFDKLKLRDVNEFKEWIKSGNYESIQTQLSPILRIIAVELILENYDRYRDVYETLLVDAFDRYREGRLDDTFTVNQVVFAEFERLVAAGGDANKQRQQLIASWRNGLKDIYFDTLKHPAQSAIDFDRWGSSVEINILAINARIAVKALGADMIGAGNGTIRLDLLTDVDYRQLSMARLGSQINSWYVLNRFADKNELIALLSPADAAIQQAMAKVLQANAKLLPDNIEGVDKAKLIDELRMRNIISPVNAGWKLLTLDSGEVDRDEISRRLQGLNQVNPKLAGIVVAAYDEKIPFVQLTLQAGHWSYKPSAKMMAQLASAVQNPRAVLLGASVGDVLNPDGHKKRKDKSSSKHDAGLQPATSPRANA